MRVDTPIGLAIVFTSLLAGVSCAKKAPAPPPGASFSLVAPQSDRRLGELRRYVAVRHRLVLETAPGGIQRAVDGLVQLCGRLNCEIVSSSISGMTGDSPPSGELSLRVAPEDLRKVFDTVGNTGRIAMHKTESEDKTVTVIDVEAKIKNVTGFRDSLRLMLGRPSATVKDLLETQRELSNVQSELDGLVTQRKVLASETDKVAVDITYRSRESAAALVPVAEAFGELGTVFFGSLATLITVAAAVFPWLLLIVPGLWFLVRVIRRSSRKRSPTG